jgi:hypothetical protein
MLKLKFEAEAAARRALAGPEKPPLSHPRPATSDLPFGHTAVERAEHKVLLTVRLLSEGDEG